MKTTRRQFAGRAALLGAGLGFGGGTALGASAQAVSGNSPAATAPQSRVRLGISSYSYWHFREPKVSIEGVIERAAALGADGVDVLHRQMDLPEKEPLTSEHRAYLNRLKRHAMRHGTNLICLSIHQDFVDPDREYLRQQVEHTKKCIEIAYQLGIPCLRLNSGRWNTIKSFDDLMKARGEEPILPGHTEDEGFKWCIDCIEQCLPKAAEAGVVLAVENHWGLTRTAEGLLRLARAVKSPWFGVLMDTGNFMESPYDKLEAIAPHTVFVQAKTYPGGGEWYTLDLDYRRIARILRNVQYTGYVSLEMEGKQNPDTAVPESFRMLRQAFA